MEIGRPALRLKATEATELITTKSFDHEESSTVRKKKKKKVTKALDFLFPSSKQSFFFSIEEF